MLGQLLDHRDHRLVDRPRHPLNVAHAPGVRLQPAALKRLLNGYYRVGMLVADKGRWHPVGSILCAHRGPIRRCLEVRKVVGTGKRQLLTKLLDLLPMAIRELGKREDVPPNLALLSLEQRAFHRTLEEPPA